MILIGDEWEEFTVRVELEAVLGVRWAEQIRGVGGPNSFVEEPLEGISSEPLVVDDLQFESLR